jgi:hypothetical protein
MIASECLMVPCILDSYLPSSLIDEVDVLTSELVLCDFVVCLDTKGAHFDLGEGWRRRMVSAPYTKKKGVSLVDQLAHQVSKWLMTLPLVPLLEQPVVVR